MQKAYISTLYELMKNDRNVVSLLSDSGTAYDAMMASEMPDQCFNFGIAEQNQLGAAAGMALCGKIPFVYSSGAFLAYRGYEFVRNDICYQNLNVKIVGMGSGTSWSTLGPSHHTTEDIAVLRSLPNLVILSPATPAETAACVREAYRQTGPVYVRIGMSGETEYFNSDYTAKAGGSTELAQGGDLAILSAGSILSEVMGARELLLESGIHAKVVNMYSIKPLDIAAVHTALSECSMLVTVEEHNIVGGFGGAIAEIIAESKLCKPFLRIGLNDRFAVGYGTQQQVRAQNALDAAGIAETITAFMHSSTD